jgi:geranylgeranyl pyrophosphate synthase
LCIGQGEELLRLKNSTPPAVDDILRIFAGKTAPAFEVALKIGAILGRADAPLLDTLQRYSQALGIAYQIRDDLLDWQSARCSDELSIVSAAGTQAAARRVLEEHRRRATDCLEGVQSAPVKTLLRRVITKIFDDTGRMGCCDEHTRFSD